MDMQKPIANRAFILLTLDQRENGELEYKVRFDGHPFDLYGLIGVGTRAVDKHLAEIEGQNELKFKPYGAEGKE